MLVALLSALSLGVGGCAAIDAIVPPASGTCEVSRLDPRDTLASFASGAACVIVTWDSTQFPSAFTADGGVGDPVELRAAADEAGYLGWCALGLSPANLQIPTVIDFEERFGSLTPKAQVWSANLFLLDHRDGAGKGYCRDWFGVD